MKWTDMIVLLACIGGAGFLVFNVIGCEKERVLEAIKADAAHQEEIDATRRIFYERCGCPLPEDIGE